MRKKQYLCNLERGDFSLSNQQRDRILTISQTPLRLFYELWSARWELHWSLFSIKLNNLVKYDRFSKIETITDVGNFVKFIYNDLEVNFHPDDDFHDIVNYETGENLFNEADADLYNILVDACFSVCEREKVDFNEIAYNYHPIIQAQINE